MNKARIATTTDGRRYFVQQIDFRTDRVHCWGEVLRVVRGQREHGPSVAFDLGKVKIGEVEVTSALLGAMFEQGAGLRREREREWAAINAQANAALKEILSEEPTRRAIEGLLGRPLSEVLGRRA